MPWSRVTPIELTDSRPLPWPASPPTAAAGESGGSLEDLAVRAQAGDAEAFRELYEVCAPAVHALLRASLPGDAVDDAHQEVFLALWGAMPRYRAARPLKPWLFGIARNVARKERRRRAKQMGGVSAIEPEAEASLQVDTTDEMNRILSKIAARPERQRILLSLRLIEGMAPAEMAVYLNSSPGSVRVRLHRALSALRADLEMES